MAWASALQGSSVIAAAWEGRHSCVGGAWEGRHHCVRGEWERHHCCVRGASAQLWSCFIAVAMLCGRIVTGGGRVRGVTTA